MKFGRDRETDRRGSYRCCLVDQAEEDRHRPRCDSRGERRGGLVDQTDVGGRCCADCGRVDLRRLVDQSETEILGLNDSLGIGPRL